MTYPPERLQSFRYEGAPMNRMLIAVAGVVAFLSAAQGTWAFTTEPVSPETMSNRLADPDELADKMSNGQSGGTTFGLPGGARLQFSAPPSGEYGIRAERTSVVGRPGPRSLATDESPREGG
jgi:hypothetical protein